MSRKKIQNLNSILKNDVYKGIVEKKNFQSKKMMFIREIYYFVNMDC